MNRLVDSRVSVRGGLGLLVSAVLLLSSCAPAGPVAPQAAATQGGAPIAVSFWHGQSGPLGKALDAQVAKFNETHPTIRVEPVFVGDFGALKQKILAALSAGQPPDLAQVGEPSTVAQYLNAKAIVPVETFARGGPDGLSEDSLRDTYPGFLDEGTYLVDGKKTIVAWPFSKAVSVIYYNENRFQSAGISRAPATWAEFRTVAKTLTEATGRPAFSWTARTQEFSAMVWDFGGDLLSADGKSARFNDPAGVKALQLLTDMALVDKSFVPSNAFDWQNDLVAQKISLGMSTIVSRTYIEDPLRGAFTLGVAPLPRADQDTAPLYGPNAVIFASSPPEKQRAAWQFLKWFTDTQQTAAWSLATGYMPVRKSAMDSSAIKEAIAKDPRRGVALGKLPVARALPNVAAWAEVDPILTDAITKAVTGKASPQAALDAAAQQANRILSAR